jgi:carbonic anhydrase
MSQKLIQGVQRFRRQQLRRYRRRFERLARKGQRPHTLFITCSDSRVVAELITQSKPGELFVVKNIGNIVPPATVAGGTNSTAAAIEFAVHVLGVSDVVVCGHSQCGAMEALLAGLPDREAMPHVREWLELAAPVREAVRERCAELPGTAERVTAAAQQNVLYGLENLRGYPVVARRLAEGSLRLHGWFFKVATAEVFAFDPQAGRFLPLAASAGRKRR